MQNLHLWTYDHEISYSGKSLKDEELLIWPLLWKNMIADGGCKLKFIFYFTETAHGQPLDKWSMVTKSLWTYMDVLLE
jgi:hypothetical protein